MKAEILAVGTELLLGDVIDTNSAYIGQRLAQIGVDVYHKSAAGDNLKRVKASVGDSLGRSDVLIITGGLGPTDDDLTKEAVADSLGLALVESEEARHVVEGYFKRSGRDMPEINLKQALVIEGSTVIRNPVGTAPGIILSYEGKIIILVPGVPREMRHMIDESVIPYLKERQVETGISIRSRVLRVVGIGESSLVELIDDILSCQSDPTIAPLASDGEVRLRITTKGSDSQEMSDRLDHVEDRIRERLGHLIYGRDDDTLPSVLISLLSSLGLTLATAESCTGGLISGAVTGVSGSSAVFLGGVVAYSNQLKQSLLGIPSQILEDHGAVSRQVAALMARSVMELTGADLGIGVTGVAGPTGGTEEKPIGLVYVACASKQRLSVARYRFSGDRDQIRVRTVKSTLNLIRKSILCLGCFGSVPVWR